MLAMPSSARACTRRLVSRMGTRLCMLASALSVVGQVYMLMRVCCVMLAVPRLVQRSAG